MICNHNDDHDHDDRDRDYDHGDDHDGLVQQRRPPPDPVAEGDGCRGGGDQGSESQGRDTRTLMMRTIVMEMTMMAVTMIIGTTTLIIVNNVSQVIAAEGENSAAQALRNASEVKEQFFKTNAKSRICHKFLKHPQVISGSPAAMQLRYLQVRYFPFLPSFEAISSYLDFLFTNI